nr:DNA gyrase subunit A [Maliibacterium massiliense]
MPRKKKEEPIVRNETILVRPMEDVIHTSMIPYAEYVIMDRALPRVEDGLKPVQRRIMYTMYDLGMWPDRPHRKCARIVGDCLGKYHPHGDSSVYDALVRMAQDFVMRAPLVGGHGNFGSIDGDSAAAMRYTEARMAPLALELLRDMEKDTVPFSLNFDDTLKEPDLLPGRFPNLLVNGASGIAVGLATNIPPHNLGEVIDAVIAQMKDPDITVRELMQYVKGPDFPTGGIMLDTEEIEKAYTTGRGRLIIRAKCAIEPAAAGKKAIVITEMPYQVNKAAMLEKIQKMAQEKKGVLAGIADIRDESDRNGIRAVIEVKRDADAELILQYLYKYSQLETSFGVNMVAIAEGKPQLLGLREINRLYIAHQKNVVTRRTQYDLDKARAREHILSGLMIALANIDEVVRLIRASKTPKDAKAALMARFALDDVQAQAILDMRLQRLTSLQVEELRREYESILKLIAQLEAILKSEKKLMRVIEKELLAIKEKYADARRTALIGAEAIKQVDAASFAVVEETVVTLAESGYIKRMAPKVYQRARGEIEPAAKAGDVVRFILEAKTDQRLLCITSRGVCHQIDVSAIPEGRWKERGMLVGSLCGGFEKDEHVVALMHAASASDEDDLMMYTARGMVKRTTMAQYAVRNKKFAGIGLKGEDRVVGAERVPPQDARTLLSISRAGMSIHTDPASIPQMGRTAGGVKNMVLGADDAVIFCRLIHPEGEIVLITDRGYGKRVLAVDFDIQNRNGKGAKTFDFKPGGASGEACVAAFYVTQPYEIVLVQRKGETTRLSTEAVPIQSRSAKGRPLVMAMLDDTVQCAFRPIY